MKENDFNSPDQVNEADTSGPATADGGTAGDGITQDQGGIDLINSATTDDGTIAIAGGKLAGHVDDFDGELDDRRLRNVPGADPENEVSPPNDRDLRQ